MLRCGVEEETEDKIYHFYGGLRRETQDIIDYKEYNNVNRLFLLVMLVEKELQGHALQQNNSNFSTSFTP
jgi:hypothetical protein